MPERQTGASSRASNKSPKSTGAAKKSAPKSFKADGTAKKRWSRDERTERGLGARRSGGQPRTQGRYERSETSQWGPRSEGTTARPERSYSDRRAIDQDRPERTTRWERPTSSDRPVRSYDRSERSDRPTSSDRPARSYDRFERSDRPTSSDRPVRSYERSERSDRPTSSDRPARSYDRFERSDRNESSDASPLFDRERASRGDDRSDRARTAAPRRESSPQRADRSGSADRGFSNDRGSSRGFDRDDRRGSSDRFRSDRPHQHAERDDDGNSDNMSWTAQEIAPEDMTNISGENGFAKLGLPKQLVAALESQKITQPFPIQEATIPDALTGRDVLGRGQTGSGKTLGFGLPMLAQLAGSTGKTPRGIVLVPTRELAMQVADVLAPLAKTVGMSVTLIAGGMAYGPQLRAFDRGVDVVVATPGRLIDLIEQGAVDLSRVEVTVLDEADHMADLGFMPAVTTILDGIPDGGQRMLFSATLDRAVDRLVRRYMKDPVTHEVDSGQATVSTMEHHLVHVLPHDKNQLTAEIAGRDGRTVVFVRTQRGADRVAEQLRDLGVMAGALHGGLTQGARSRIMAAFKDGQVPVLVATDVAARGIHVDDIGLVLQVLGSS